jgi:carbonic anhydrase
MRRIIPSFLVTLLICLPLAAQAVTPDALWDALVKGNKQFVAGKLAYDKLKDERAQLRNAQAPPVTVLSCSDSRLPPELVFNQSLGALFVVRSAGGVTDTLGLGSIEYAITKGYTSLIVVIGHEGCGAVTSALAGDDPASPYILALAQRIRTAFGGIVWDPKDPKMVRKAIEANARASAAWLPAQSRIVRDAVLTGKLKIVAAYYSLETGEITKLEP